MSKVIKAILLACVPVVCIEILASLSPDYGGKMIFRIYFFYLSVTIFILLIGILLFKKFFKFNSNFKFYFGAFGLVNTITLLFQYQKGAINLYYFLLVLNFLTFLICVISLSLSRVQPSRHSDKLTN
jgi:hypothetical protein